MDFDDRTPLQIKIEALNNLLLLLAIKYDLDSLPVFFNKRSVNKCLRWMVKNKFSKKDAGSFMLLYVSIYGVVK